MAVGISPCVSSPVSVVNPLAHYLFWEAVAVGEMTCDDAALRDRTKKQKADYIRCIMTASRSAGRPLIVAPSLGMSKSLLRRRMERIMGTGGKKVWKRKMAVTLMVVCVMTGSIPAMAYQKPACIHDTGDGSEWKGFDMLVQDPPGTEKPLDEKPMDFRLGDEILTDERGRVYCKVEQNDVEQSSCEHSYRPVTYATHKKKLDGNCTEVRYDAGMCTKCGALIKGEEIITATYKPCPH